VTLRALMAFLDEAPHSQLTVIPGQPVEPGRYERVAVVLQDRVDLRELELPKGVRTAALAVWLADGISALSLTPRPEWPSLELIRSRRVDDGWLTVLRFATPAPVHAVIRELGRQSVWPDRVGDRGLVVGHSQNEKVPADVIIADWHLTWDEADHPVTGRAPYVVTERDGPIRVGPLDERVLNPTGFDPDAKGPVVALATIDPVRERVVRSLRGSRGVLADGSSQAAESNAGQIARLAMAGVPVTAPELVPEVRHLLGDTVADAILAPVDLTDRLAREEHSIVLRRAALNEFSSFAWRRRLAELARVRVHWQPTVSVVMATRRPELLDHAVGQVARQRGVESLELVLAPHGFEPDRARVQELAGPSVTVQLVSRPEDVVFGDVLQSAADRAGGDVVLKMDDDDWYAPDFVADLLLARTYSGAELVGMPDDHYYLESRDLTVRLGQRSEVHRQFVAGGTILVEASLLSEVGGFRSVRRHVDAQLLHAVRRAGGAIYRTHGLGYCLRRATSGHTWETDLDDVEKRAAESWPGFRLSRLMEQ
jgi:hypothetical protein